MIGSAAAATEAGLAPGDTGARTRERERSENCNTNDRTQSRCRSKRAKQRTRTHHLLQQIEAQHNPAFLFQHAVSAATDDLQQRERESPLLHLHSAVVFDQCTAAVESLEAAPASKLKFSERPTGQSFLEAQN